MKAIWTVFALASIGAPAATDTELLEAVGATSTAWGQCVTSHARTLVVIAPKEFTADLANAAMAYCFPERSKNYQAIIAAQEKTTGLPHPEAADQSLERTERMLYRAALRAVIEQRVSPPVK